MGKHLIIEIYGSTFEEMNNSELIVNALVEGCKSAGMTVLNVYTHLFEPQGFTSVIALSESHCSIHTWPENGSAAVDIYTCGSGDPREILTSLTTTISFYDYRVRELQR